MDSGRREFETEKTAKYEDPKACLPCSRNANRAGTVTEVVSRRKRDEGWVVGPVRLHSFYSECNSHHLQRSERISFFFFNESLWLLS